MALPVGLAIVFRTEKYIDEKTGQERRKTSKNELARNMLQALTKTRFHRTDIWFASAENMRFVKLDLKRDLIMALKSNCKVALSDTR